ncbi:MAG TPA: Crp/Fnr family transcriptional regulator [Candidatus Acidoferrales bacterium]|nr:Crp/Fnr family transcriptional regulator [Candidatus Acidoferrales bacterium]
MIELLRGMRKEGATAVLAAASTQNFQTGEVIITAGERAKNLFLIRIGVVNCFCLTPDGREIALGLLGPGEVFGVGTLLTEPSMYAATTQSVRAVEAYVWSHASIRRLTKIYPELSENVFRIVLANLASFVGRHISLLSKTAEQRLFDTLIRLGDNIGRQDSGGIQVEVKNEHLASLADVNYFTVSRLLKNWERSGVIKKGRGIVTILHPEYLHIK